MVTGSQLVLKEVVKSEFKAIHQYTYDDAQNLIGMSCYSGNV